MGNILLNEKSSDRNTSSQRRPYSAQTLSDFRPTIASSANFQLAKLVDNRSSYLPVKNVTEPTMQLKNAGSPVELQKPLQRLANRHGLTLPNYQTATGFTVLVWGRLTGPGIITNLNAVRAGPAGHAEDQLIAQANAVIAGAAPGTYIQLEVWISSSPCSTAFGTRVAVASGCLEDLQVFAAANGMMVHVHAQKPYQPRGLGPGMKQNSVNAANGAGPNILHDFDTRTGVAAGLAAYAAPAGLPAAGLGTVAQLTDSTSSNHSSTAAEIGVKKAASKKMGSIIVTYE